MIKVRAGQVWAIDDSEFKLSHICGGKDNSCVSVGWGWINIEEFYDKFKFIPQNDLEKLAVNVDEWTSKSVEHNLYRGGDSIYWVDYRYQHDSYTRQQWQNMRYHLGLDKKPHCRLVKGEWVKQ
jgi:hypothetical protein